MRVPTRLGWLELSLESCSKLFTSAASRDDQQTGFGGKIFIRAQR